MVDHVKYPANVMDVPTAWMLEGMIGGDDLAFQKTDLIECQNRYGGSFVALYRRDSAEHLAKLLRSYDESPTSQKWIDIQQLAREILK
ncbi:hypothetical protein D3C77_332690 [compost metagenome]